MEPRIMAQELNQEILESPISFPEQSVGLRKSFREKLQIEAVFIQI